MPKHRRRGDHRKRSLAQPDLEQTRSAVLNTVTSKSGQRTYDHAINEFVDWYRSEPRLAFFALWSSDTEFTSKSGTSLEQRSISAWLRSGVWRTKQPIPACSVQNLALDPTSQRRTPNRCAAV